METLDSMSMDDVEASDVDRNLHKRLNALGCPIKNRPKHEGHVVWDNTDMFNDTFRLSLVWNATTVRMQETFKPSGSTESQTLWGMGWKRDTAESGSGKWTFDPAFAYGDTMNGITTIEATVKIARDAVQRVGTRGVWTPLDPALLAPVETTSVESAKPSRLRFPS